MSSKSKTLKKASTTSSLADYTLYKYADIQNSWIMCEGHLNYRYDRIKLLNISQFAIFYVVLAKIPTDGGKQIVGVYLYRNQKQNPSNFFQLDEYDRISDQSAKTIKSKYFLFELIGKDPNDIEIFGAADVNERDKWTKHLNEALNWTRQNSSSENFSVAHLVIKHSRRNIAPNSEHSNADVRSNYEPFAVPNTTMSIDEFESKADESNRNSVLNNVFLVPHRPVPPIPVATERKSTTDQETENIYLEAQDLPVYVIQQEDEPKSALPDDLIFSWKNIFYSNEYDDHASILNDIGEIGAFLIRPQLKRNKSKDHEYTLSIYAFGGIIKYKILHLLNGKFGLTLDDQEPNFDTIPDLCQYYTNHSLPRSPLRDDPIKGPVGNLSLKWPYTYYSRFSNKF
ncbi:unnamed protein product [Adineta ricciae]|uniref:SH2 domain-containing protein n=1 Tax=Adineta ricciae TaxID=249248 RepID=A0A815Q0U9_ADIRI|nr:unnamed protein product [Adineta ricciae]CAF1582022.1 unnamed protein product [Adineta ricciae]